MHREDALIALIQNPLNCRVNGFFSMISCGIKLLIPAVLQRNQIWNIQGLPASNTITLIDNKGQTVFKAINYKNNTGFNHLAVGLYYYQIMLKGKDGKPELYRGKLMIIP